MSEQEREGARRLEAEKLVAYSCVRRDGLHVHRGLARTIDASEDGMRIHTWEPLPLGESVEFSIQIGDEVYRLTGRVRWGAEDEGEEGRYEFGIRFATRSLAFACRVFELLEEQLESDRVKAAEELGLRLLDTLERRATRRGSQVYVRLGANAPEGPIDARAA